MPAVTRGSILLSNYQYQRTHPIWKTLYKTPPKGFTINQTLATRPQNWVRAFRNMVLGQVEADVVPNTNDDAVLSVGLLPKTDKPWSAIIEHYSVFSNNLFYLPLRRASLKRDALRMVRAPNCHKILAYTDIAGKGILEWLGDKNLASKIETLYPGIEDKQIKRIKHKKPTILFIANTDFYGKGGKEVLAIADIVLKEHDVQFIIKSPVPKEYLEAYRGRKGIEFITDHLSDAQLDALYGRSDIYLFPLYTSSFGVYLEAMRAGLPIITSSHFDMTEIVRNGKNGFTVDTPHYFFQRGFEYAWMKRSQYTAFLKGLHQPNVEAAFAKRVIQLIKQPVLARRMGAFGKREVSTGRFSTKVRNKQLARIYGEMVKLRR